MSHSTIKEQAAKLFGKPEQRYLNRELSWLAFNDRVLEESGNKSHPLLERLKFLAISANNMDEFYMVRVAGLKAQVRHAVITPSDDGLSPAQQLEKISQASQKLMEAQQQRWKTLSKELKAAGIEVRESASLKPQEVEHLRSYFQSNLFPVLTPLAIDPAHPFPFLANRGLALVLQLAEQKKRKEQTVIIPIPAPLPRLVPLPGRAGHFVPLEEVIELFVEDIFPGFKKLDSGLFRLLRDSELAVAEEAEDLMQHFEQALKVRRRGIVIRLEIKEGMSSALAQFVAQQLRVAEIDIVTMPGMLALGKLIELYDSDRPELKFPLLKARFPERINDYGGDCFAAIHAKDIIVHHPYESFDVVVQFLRQAARDPKVLSIKQTLYRTSRDSPVVTALIEAAEAGKSVTAVVELKARFDEEANIKLARDMERAGVQVVYGVASLKTHAKISLVTRQEDANLRSYVHFGTGNYHPVNARFYTDLSFFTCDPLLCQDASQLFNYLTGYAPPKKLEKLVTAPNLMRKHLLALIEEEIANARQKRPAQIWAKINALVDPELIDALYRASQEGVEIDLVVRGMCCLRPGIKGLSERIRVKSIVGRFLEHSRIFCFGGGAKLPHASAKVYISSADWMVRNFNSRVEVMVPIENPTVHAQVLNQIMVANMKDEKQSWFLKPDGHYVRSSVKSDSLSAHDYFLNNPSLSGRGKALKAHKPHMTDTQPKKHG